MKDDQLTFRVPRDLLRQLKQLARSRGVPASQLVREAVQAYLAAPRSDEPEATWHRVAPLIGSLALDAEALEHDALAAQLKAHNWRE